MKNLGKECTFPHSYLSFLYPFLHHLPPPKKGILYILRKLIFKILAWQLSNLIFKKISLSSFYSLQSKVNYLWWLIGLFSFRYLMTLIELYVIFLTSLPLVYLLVFLLNCEQLSCIMVYTDENNTWYNIYVWIQKALSLKLVS